MEGAPDVFFFGDMSCSYPSKQFSSNNSFNAVAVAILVPF